MNYSTTELPAYLPTCPPAYGDVVASTYLPTLPPGPSLLIPYFDVAHSDSADMLLTEQLARNLTRRYTAFFSVGAE
eukprot:473382-Rhodomonas_salina.2